MSLGVSCHAANVRLLNFVLCTKIADADSRLRPILLGHAVIEQDELMQRDTVCKSLLD